MNDLDFLEIGLHGRTVGYLVSLTQGQNRLYFSPEYVHDKNRATFSLTTHHKFPKHHEQLSTPWTRWQRLHPVLSNLLPEGAFRETLARTLKVHIDHEFLLLKHLGQDLPGAITATPITPDAVPAFVMQHIGMDTKENHALQMNDVDLAYQNHKQARPFSLAGVQTKFSMRQIFTQTGERFTLPLSSQDALLGDWIIKTPSLSHPFVPENEYSMMRLAESAQVQIPPMKLVPLDQLVGVHDETLLSYHGNNKPLAYAIKRFDRQVLSDGRVQRVHSEDFAQILVKYPHEKYQGGNYAQLAKILYQFSENGLSDVNQLARRILVNILVANGDAHLKNWSVIYKDGINPTLSPAYDIVSTKMYLPNETHFSLNLDATKHWHQVNMAHFEHWAKKADIPWRSVKPQLTEVMQIARETWKTLLDDLPMIEIHKKLLMQHWTMLSDDFKVV